VRLLLLIVDKMVSIVFVRQIFTILFILVEVFVCFPESLETVAVYTVTFVNSQMFLCCFLEWCGNALASMVVKAQI